MHPADETPTSGQKAHELKHIHENLQASPPGTPEKPTFFVKPGRNTSADLSRLYLQYISKPTQDRHDQLVPQCLLFLERRVRYWIISQHFRPDWSSPDAFCLAAFDRARDKFYLGLCSLENPNGFVCWLKTVAFSAVAEENREIKGRAKSGSRSWGPLEIEHDDGSVTQVLDRGENREAAARNGYVTVSHVQFVKDLVYRDVLGKLFRAARNCSKRQREGIALLKLTLTRDLTAEEIAAQYGLKSSHVLTLLHRARKKLREIAETEYGLTAEDLGL